MQRAVLSRQVHRSDVRRVTAVDCGKGLWRPQDYDSADALVTDVPGIPLIVFSADCNVLLLHDPVRRVIGAAHAGWRGTAAGIAAETVRVMAEDYGREGVTCIDICDHCTACRPDLYWSHRKMGLRRGEQAALIALREDTL